ncbi:MAG: hypothetical protein KY476_23540 [Planctomycetes bacterium]|nr:hypothetical protein [Planctomycetota bacterium]
MCILRGSFSSAAFPVLLVCLLAGSPAARADERSHEHRHTPVDVDARPMVARLPLSLTGPRRALVEPSGSLVVADWAAGSVLRFDQHGVTSILASDLDEPAGLACDDMGNLYVAVHAGGMSGGGRIVQIAADGLPVDFAGGLTGPADVAVGPDGLVYVAQLQGGSILRIAQDGQADVMAAGLPGPAAVEFDRAGNLYVASATEGAVFRVSPMGMVTTVTRELDAPTDLVLHPDGPIVAVNYGGTELALLTADGGIRRFAVVPAGTIGIAFDLEANLLLVNWDDHYVMKVTTFLSIPCPHCRQPIPVRLRPGQAPTLPSPPSDQSGRRPLL